MSYEGSSKRNSSKLMASEAKSVGNEMSACESSEKLTVEGSFAMGNKKYLPSNNKMELSYISWDDLHLQNDALYMIIGGSARNSHKNSYQKALLGQGSFGKVFKAKWRIPASNFSSDQSSIYSEIDVAVKILFTDKATFNIAKVKAKANDELYILKFAQEESLYRAGFLKPYGMAIGYLSPQFFEILSRKETNNYSECLGIVTSVGGIELLEYLRCRKTISHIVEQNIMESIVRALTELHAICK